MDLAQQIILIMFITLPILLAMGVPISISIGMASFLPMLIILPFNNATLVAAQRMFMGINSFPLIAIPFFILAGNIMNRGGIALRLIRLANIFGGNFYGSLSQANVISNMLFGAVSGSGVAAAAAVGSTIAPIQEKEGYDPSFSAAVNIASAPTGMLIPPSNTLIVYSTVAGSISISALFVAGYLPGILWGIGIMMIVAIVAQRLGYRSQQQLTFKLILKIFYQAIPSLLLIVIVIGGILNGVFTATEGSAVAVVYSLFLAFIYKELKVKDLPTIFLHSAKMATIVIFMIGISSIMSWVMAYAHIPQAIANLLLGISNNPIILLIIINIILLVVGTFMDPVPAILIFTPIFLPIVQSFGLSAIHFGIIITFNLSIGTITPPVGPILFTGCRVAGLSIEQVIKPLLPFYLITIIMLILVTYIPLLSLALPQWLNLIK